jgi:3-dehydroquinate dehydratase/shikimate dehydrogenase
MSLICVSLKDETTAALVDRMSALGDAADLFEIRGDLVQELDLLAIIRARQKPLLFACRTPAEGGEWGETEARRRDTLLEAVRRGFDYVDAEHRSGLTDVMLEKTGRGLVVSYHDFEGTPDDLQGLYEAMCARGADIVKLAVTPRSMEDVGRVLATSAQAFRSGGTPLVAIAMGPMGLITRLAGGRFGAPFTFAATGRGGETASGQVPARDMADLYHVRSVGPRTKVYGVLGSDVLFSLSPLLHNRAFRAAGLDCLYLPLQTDRVEPFMKALPDLGLEGFSVTRPFKIEIIPFLSALEASAADCGSVNTVLVRKDGLLGMSTDGVGVLGPLRKRLTVKDSRVIVLGAGGAARAAAFALQQKGGKTTILARDLSRAESVARAVGCASAPLSSLPEQSWDVLVNATPLGGRHAPSETPVPAGLLGKGRLVFDMVYDPLETRLLREAREAGCATIGGLEMLVTQAAAQFEAWTGCEAPVDVMSAAAVAFVEAPE